MHENKLFTPYSYSEIESRDIGRSNWYEESDTPQDQVEYEDTNIEKGRRIRAKARLEKPFSARIEVVVEPLSTTAPTHLKTAPTRSEAMENIHQYSDRGGIAEKTFKQEAKDVYSKILRDPQEHLLVGFRQWEFIKLLGPRVLGEARAVHMAFMDFWDFENGQNPILEDAFGEERRRKLWRDHRRDEGANVIMRDHSPFSTRPVKPAENEPCDLERCFDCLEARFKSSTTRNLTVIHNFKPIVNEIVEMMFAHFKMLRKVAVRVRGFESQYPHSYVDTPLL